MTTGLLRMRPVDQYAFSSDDLSDEVDEQASVCIPHGAEIRMGPGSLECRTRRDETRRRNTGKFLNIRIFGYSVHMMMDC